MKPQRTSLIWSHFVLNKDTEALCKYCRKSLSFHGKTSNLIKHMKRKHPEALQSPVKHERVDVKVEVESVLMVEEVKKDKNVTFNIPEIRFEGPDQENDRDESDSDQERITVVNIDATCRICLSDLSLIPDPVQYVSLQSRFHLDVSYQEIFKDCTGFELEAAEPQIICCQCAEKLLVAHELRVKCTETQKILQEWLKIETSDRNVEQNKVRVDSETEEGTGIVEFLIEEDESHIHSPVQAKNPETKTRICPICDVKASRSHICRHISSASSVNDVTGHGLPKSFGCDICGARATTKTGITSHIKTQHMNFTLQCKYCKTEYRSRLVLNSHIRRVHPDKKSPLKCAYCEYTTPNFPNFFRHRLTHTRTKLHKCETCGREFVTKENWRTHVASHSDQRPFPCEICKSTFKTKKSLGVHMKSHRAPEYECPVCRRGFLTNQLMRLHATRVHPEFELPPRGTILNKAWRIKKATQDLKENVMRLGFDGGIVRSVIIDESYLNSGKKYVRKNKIKVEK